MHAINHPLRFDNTQRVKMEAEMLGDSILSTPFVKETYLFKVGQQIKASGNGTSRQGRSGKIVHRFKIATGYCQYVVSWDDTPAKRKPYKAPNGEWVNFYKENGFETLAQTERQKDLIDA
jgi:hypothetical protein